MARIRSDVTEADVRDWCCQYLARALKLSPGRIDHQATFSRLGLDSAESLFLVAALEDWSGLELASDIAFEHPSVSDLARYVIGRFDESRGSGASA